MTDLIARLRDADTTRRIGESYADTHERRQHDRDEAAAEIERLRAALREIADHTTNPEGSGPAYRMVGKLVRTARAALGEKETRDE